MGQWHNLECLESGTVIMECKDGKYEALKEDELKEKSMEIIVFLFKNFA